MRWRMGKLSFHVGRGLLAMLVFQRGGALVAGMSGRSLVRAQGIPEYAVGLYWR